LAAITRECGSCSVVRDRSRFKKAVRLAERTRERSGAKGRGLEPRSRSIHSGIQNSPNQYRMPRKRTSLARRNSLDFPRTRVPCLASALECVFLATLRNRRTRIDRSALGKRITRSETNVTFGKSSESLTVPCSRSTELLEKLRQSAPIA